MMRNLILHSIPTLLLASCLVALAPQLTGPGPRAQSEAEIVACRVRHADGRLDTTIDLARLAAPDSEWFVAGSDLADILQVGRYWRSDVRKLVLRIDDQRVTFTVGARAVVGADETLLLRHEVAFHRGEPWIPLEFLTTVLPQLTQRRVDFDPEQFRIRLGERNTNITALELENVDGATELRLRLTAPLAFRVDDSRARRLVLKIYGGSLSSSQIALGRPQGLVQDVTSDQMGEYALVVVQLSELASRYQSLTEDQGKTILLRIEQGRVSTIPDPVPRGPHLVQTLPPEARGRRVVVRRVVVDPGHGGSDIGATGRGLREKDVTLAVARELERILERRNDIEVVLTRTDDTNLGLIQRTELANREGADLFLSLHCNAWYDSGARGVETYFLSPAQSEWDASVARAENSTVGAAEDLDFILWDLVQNVYIQESATLAEAVQNQMARSMDMENRGVKQAGFRVLVGAFMPAILVELGFVTNSDDASKLGERDYQRRAAQALADAVIDFRTRMDAIREESR
jgi:N-acetylmuramoyl-L-alanine amidase